MNDLNPIKELWYVLTVYNHCDIPNQVCGIVCCSTAVIPRTVPFNVQNF